MEIIMETMRWENDTLMLLDQTKLPQETGYIRCKDYQTVAKAICDLSVRGAPAIGVAAAYGFVLGLSSAKFQSYEEMVQEAEKVCKALYMTRPTAVNLKWGLDRMMNKLKSKASHDPDEMRRILLEEAHEILREDIETNKAIGKHGQELIPDGAGILNHCNAGALATAGYGTSLGVIRAAIEAGKKVIAYVDETRPLLQGARLTAWEMVKEKIPACLITDNMAASLMAQGKIDLVVVGADRITANGDTANKIGTYGLAVLAKAHNIPFYVAAPYSTVDFSLEHGKEIPIEERNHKEVTHMGGRRIAPEGIEVWNPAFDVTPGKYISAIITEKGVIRPPYSKNLKKAFDL